MKKSFIAKMCVLLAGVLLVCTALTGCFGSGEDDSSGEPKMWIIQYTDDNGTHQLQVMEGMPYSIEDEIPERIGYEFLGLFDMEEGGTRYIAANGGCMSVYTDKRNMVLFPQWQAKKYLFVLNYGNAHSEGVNRIEVAFGEEILSLPEDLYCDGSNFVGWYSSKDASGKRFINGTTLNKSHVALADEDDCITLYAVFS